MRRFPRLWATKLFPLATWDALDVDASELDEAWSEWELYRSARSTAQTMAGRRVPLPDLRIEAASINEVLDATPDVHEQPGRLATAIRMLIEGDRDAMRPKGEPVADRGDELCIVAMMMADLERDRIRLLADPECRKFLTWAKEHLRPWEQQDMRTLIAACLEGRTIDLTLARRHAVEVVTGRLMRDREQSEREKLEAPARKVAEKLTAEAARIRAALEEELAA